MDYLYTQVTPDEALSTCNRTTHFKKDYPSRLIENVVITVSVCESMALDSVFILIRIGKPSAQDCLYFRRFVASKEEVPLEQILTCSKTARLEAHSCERQHEAAARGLFD